MSSALLDRLQRKATAEPPKQPDAVPETLPTEQAITAKIEAAVLSGSANAIVQALLLRQAMPMLKLGAAYRQAEIDARITWPRRVAWCKAREQEARDALKVIREAPGRRLIGQKAGSDYLLRAAIDRLNGAIDFADRVRRSVTEMRQVIALAAAGDDQRSQMFLRQVESATVDAEPWWVLVEREEREAGRAIVLPEVGL